MSGSTDGESLHHFRRTESDVIAATGRPATVDSLTADLRSLGVRQGDVLVVHTSLSNMGFVVGGARAVVDALVAAVGAEGTVTMPAHSGEWSEPSHWQNPPVPDDWWQVIRDHQPAFDPYTTPLREMGGVADALLMRRSTLRSEHPRCSHMALGPHAEYIVSPHPIDDAFGERSPLARLHAVGALVLLLGVGHSNNTSLHLAESRASWPGKATEAQGSAVTVDGRRVWSEYHDLSFDTDDFDAVGTAFEATGAVHLGTVGQAHARLMPMAALVGFATDWFSRHRR